MRRLALGTLLPFGFLCLLGAAHCEEGDELAFGSRADTVPVVLASRVASSVVQSQWLNIVVYSSGQVVVSRELEGSSEGSESRTAWVYGPELRRLHDDLVEAGGTDLTGFVGDNHCIGASNHATRVTVFEPAGAAGTAWSTTFQFTNCTAEPRAQAVWTVLARFVAEQLGPELLQP